MPIEPNNKQAKADGQLPPEQQPFKGIRKYVESGDVIGLMRELNKVPTDTKQVILNKLSMSDGNGGRIELDQKTKVPMPDAIRKKALEQLKNKQQTEQGSAT